jgi:hypothetical protein
MVPHETVWGMRQARSPAFWDVPIGVYRMTGDEAKKPNLAFFVEETFMSSYEQNHDDDTESSYQRHWDISPPDVDKLRNLFVIQQNKPGRQQIPVQQRSRQLFSRRQFTLLGFAILLSFVGGAIIVSEFAHRYGLFDTATLAPAPDSDSSMVVDLQPLATQEQATSTTRPSTPTATPQRSTTPTASPELTTTTTPPESTQAMADATPEAMDALPDTATVQPDDSTTGTVSRPPIVSNAEWSGMTSNIPFVPQQPELITLHHEGVIFDGSMPADEYLRSVQRWSITNRGWPDIPYHFMIDLEGVIYEGRPINARGSTNTGYDTQNMVQVAVLGKYDAGEQVPNQMQIEAIIDIMAWIAATYNIPPDAAHIKGHRDYIPFNESLGYHIDARTGEKITCPGDNLYVYLENGIILNGIAERLAMANNVLTTPTILPNTPANQVR